MKFVFRVDAGLHIGSGHVMRCLTLADALHKQGAECVFICRLFSGNLCDLIEQKGYQVCSLPNSEFFEPTYNQEQKIPHEHWLGVNWQEDARQTIDYFKQLSVSSDKPNWLIIDHYALDYQWENTVKVYVDNIMVIDDLADRKHHCQLLLDQNLGTKLDDYKDFLPDDCATLLGPKYALLRDEFYQRRKVSLKRREATTKIKQILITMGGIDQYNITGELLNALKGCLIPSGCKLVVVMGSQAPHLEKVKKIAPTMPWETQVLVNIANMAELMVESDLAIGAAGSTSWERCCLGLPSIMFITAMNQMAIARSFQQKNLAFIINATDCIENELKRSLIEIQKPNNLMNFSFRVSVIVDGMGVKRVLRYFDT